MYVLCHCHCECRSGHFGVGQFEFGAIQFISQSDIILPSFTSEENNGLQIFCSRGHKGRRDNLQSSLCACLMLLGIDFVLVCLIVSERACVCALRGVRWGGGAGAGEGGWMDSRFETEIVEVTAL